MKKQFFSGMKAGIPIVFGFIPVGIAFALMAASCGFSGFETCFMSLTVFAGASQMMAVEMFKENAGTSAIVIATLVINLRHIIMSTCVMNKLECKSKPKKLLASFGVTDETFAVFTTGKASSFAFLIGLILVAYSSWNVGTLMGALISDFIPDIISNSFNIAFYAMFISLLMPSVKANKRLLLLVLLTAVVNTLVSIVLPSSWAVIVSTLLCAFIGVFFVDLEEGQNG